MIHHPYHYLADDEAGANDFMRAQHDGSLSLGHTLAHHFDFQPYTCLLDLGGGSGAYSTAILKRYPHMQAVIFDLPQVCRIAAASAQEAGLAQRIRVIAGDYEHDPLPSGPDIVLWSGNLHASSPERCRHVINQIAAMLPMQGALLIHDYLLDDSRTGPLIPALLALHLTLVSDDGQVYSGQELKTLLAAAGFADITVQPFLPGHSGLVTARKAEA
jgi:cyclopropane fatty-acyl-phospholipid synthase-like methyltransferase